MTVYNVATLVNSAGLWAGLCCSEREPVGRVAVFGLCGPSARRSALNHAGPHHRARPGSYGFYIKAFCRCSYPERLAQIPLFFSRQSVSAAGFVLRGLGRRSFAHERDSRFTPGSPKLTTSPARLPELSLCSAVRRSGHISAALHPKTLHRKHWDYLA